MAIEADSRWQGGHFAPGEGPVDGPRSGARHRDDHLSVGYRVRRAVRARSTRDRARYDVEHYLRRQGEKLVERFDARSYVALMGAMDAHDVGDLARAGARTAGAGGEVVGVGIDTDILYYPTRCGAGWAPIKRWASMRNTRRYHPPTVTTHSSLSGSRSGGYCGQPRKVSSARARLTCRSRLSAFSLICRTRSRVMPSRLPISSSVIGSGPSSPK